MSLRAWRIPALAYLQVEHARSFARVTRQWDRFLARTEPAARQPPPRALPRVELDRHSFVEYSGRVYILSRNILVRTTAPAWVNSAAE